ncbi:MAG: hypothetical protein HY063_10970 [Bacteroidetes bacterium]|nr:hypothetical protein [Bacteroidota bacterium]
MKTEKVIVEIIPISKQGEIKHFQVRVPSDAKIIFGIETDVRIKGPTADSGVIAIPPAPTKTGGTNFSQNPDLINGAFPNDSSSGQSSFVGELKLQSNARENIFYAASISDLNAELPLRNFSTKDILPERIWTHLVKMEIQKVTLERKTTVINGFYKDKLGEFLKQDFTYEVILSVWYKTEKQ